jgi:hypothetical protein
MWRFLRKSPLGCDSFGVHLKEKCYTPRISSQEVSAQKINFVA